MHRRPQIICIFLKERIKEREAEKRAFLVKLENRFSGCMHMGNKRGSFDYTCQVEFELLNVDVLMRFRVGLYYWVVNLE